MNNKFWIYQLIKLNTLSLKMNHRLVLFIILALIVSPFSYAQDGESSVFLSIGEKNKNGYLFHLNRMYCIG